MPDDERLRQAIRVGNIGIFDHVHATDVIFWSLELRQMYGWDADEPVTLPKIISHVHPGDTAQVIAAVKRAHDPEGDGAFDIEHRILDRQGGLRWLQTRSKTHFGLVSGRLVPTRTIGAVQDVTYRHAAEERLRALDTQLRQAQKMESIGRLAGGIAHDFNNFLTVIATGLDLSLETLPASHPGRAHLAVMAEAAKSATALTRQLLAFSRKEVIAPKLLDLNEIVGRAEEMILRLVGADIVVETRCRDDVRSIRFDPGQVEQILVNLALNARDAMPDGGRLSIETSRVSIDEGQAARHVDARPGAYARLAVSDDGTGMSDDVQSHLFEPFFTTKAPGRGTGLGLAMVYGAVRQNGGWIEVRSELGRGTTFEIFLPEADGVPQQPPARAPVAAGRAAILMLVEDDPRILRLASSALRNLGYDVHGFASGPDALNALPSLRPAPELLITDVVMPGMNGRVLAERVVALLPDIRVLFVSGYAESFVMNRGGLRDGIEFLAKPYSADQLARRVRELLGDAAAAPGPDA